jgi:hypothetical protein
VPSDGSGGQRRKSRGSARISWRSCAGSRAQTPKTVLRPNQRQCSHDPPRRFFGSALSLASVITCEKSMRNLPSPHDRAECVEPASVARKASWTNVRGLGDGSLSAFRNYGVLTLTETASRRSIARSRRWIPIRRRTTKKMMIVSSIASACER